MDKIKVLIVKKKVDSERVPGSMYDHFHTILMVGDKCIGPISDISITLEESGNVSVNVTFPSVDIEVKEKTNDRMD